MRSPRLPNILLTALLFLAFARTGQSADSCDPIRTFADDKRSLREIFVFVWRGPRA